jgi:hypothetical protein
MAELGLVDDQGDDLMGEFLPTGTRRLPPAVVPALTAADLPGASRASDLSSPLAAAAVDHLFEGHHHTSATGSGDSSAGSRDAAVAIPGSMSTIVRLRRRSDQIPENANPSQVLAGTAQGPLEKGTIGLRTRAKKILWTLFD